MGKRVIEVALDEQQIVFVEVEDDYYYGGEDPLAPVANPGKIPARAEESVRSAIDNVVMPTLHTVFDRISRDVRGPDSIELEFGLKMAGKLGAVFACTETEGHIKVKMTWNQIPRASGSSTQEDIPHTESDGKQR